ncbi:MAG: DNA polymerase III subunit delta [Candidatus Parabeggiatoa sp. nov. 1]|nr:MAG: DNA polymerase III subunit delta [Gammaproteobacteria bacterium]
MRLKPTQLNSHLKQKKLAPLYLLTGDEPLQMMECADTLRTFARAQGFTERVVLTVETGFDWGNLDQYANSLSLFATQRLLEIRLSNKSPGNEGTKALIAYANQPPSDTVLLITADKLDASKQKTKWFTTLDERGIIIQVWPLNVSDLPGWIAQRMNHYGLQASPEAINMIAERAEGHLLACAQEIEKLRLLYGAGRIDITQVLDAVADSARFEVFGWVDTVLAGDVPRCIRQLQVLQTEGVEPVLVAWALNKEIRNLCQITYALQKGQRLDQLFKTYRVWSTRKNAVSRAIKRHPQPSAWQQLLPETVQIDRMIKGVDKGNPWNELQRLSLRVAGVNLFGKSHV